MQNGGKEIEASPGVRVCEALQYALFYPIFPCRKDKTPLTPHGFKDATTDKVQISVWWGDINPEAIGIPTGAESGFWVLDIDGEAGEATLKGLEANYGSLPLTIQQRTGGGDRHLFFAWPKTGEPIRNSAGKLGAGLDVRGEGGLSLIHI